MKRVLFSEAKRKESPDLLKQASQTAYKNKERNIPIQALVEYYRKREQDEDNQANQWNQNQNSFNQTPSQSNVEKNLKNSKKSLLQKQRPSSSNMKAYQALIFPIEKIIDEKKNTFIERKVPLDNKHIAVGNKIEERLPIIENMIEKDHYLLEKERVGKWKIDINSILSTLALNGQQIEQLSRKQPQQIKQVSANKMKEGNYPLSCFNEDYLNQDSKSPHFNSRRNSQHLNLSMNVTQIFADPQIYQPPKKPKELSQNSNQFDIPLRMERQSRQQKSCQKNECISSDQSNNFRQTARPSSKNQNFLHIQLGNPFIWQFQPINKKQPTHSEIVQRSALSISLPSKPPPPISTHQNSLQQDKWTTQSNQTSPLRWNGSLIMTEEIDIRKQNNRYLHRRQRKMSSGPVWKEDYASKTEKETQKFNKKCINECIPNISLLIDKSQNKQQ